DNYALSLSTAQVVALGMIALLTVMNMGGIEYGKIVQNLFTVTKTSALLGMIVLGLTLGWNAVAVQKNFGSFDQFWKPHQPESGGAGLPALTAFGVFVALCVSQPGSLFSADSWHNVTIIAGEVKQPRRNLPLALVFGTGLVIALYLMANVAYLVTLPLSEIK